jgi:predicted RNase H-like HicB family nuclease
MFNYPVTLTPDDGSVLVTFADVPEAITFGADEDEALLNAIDALETGLSFYVDARLLQANQLPDRKPCLRQRWNVPSWGCIRP